MSAVAAVWGALRLRDGGRHGWQMSEGVWWLRVGDARVDVVVDGAGQVAVSIERGVYGAPPEPTE